MDVKVSIVFNRNCFPKVTDFSRLGALQAVTYTVKVVLSKKWREIDILLIHTTNRKYHMAYLFMPFPVTLDDHEGHAPNAGLIKCDLTNICAKLARFYDTRCYFNVRSNADISQLNLPWYHFYGVCNCHGASRPTLPMKNLPWKGRGQGQVTRFRILHPM